MGVLDAWAYGIPCVVTPVGGLPDIVIDGENALVFPVGDVDMLYFQPLYEGVNTAFATFIKINNDRLARKIKTLLYSLLLKRSKLLENKQKTA